MTANTVLADINEIWTAYCLNNKKWFDNDAKKQYNDRVTQAKPEEVADAQGKAEVMAKDFIKWAKNSGYSGRITNVWWTARPNSMSQAVGRPVDQRKNPTDVLVKFAKGPKGTNGFLGLSAKATKGKSDIGFKNPGIGTVDKSLGTKFGELHKKELEKTIKQLSLPASAKPRKQYIRENAGIKTLTNQTGLDLMKKMRDQMLSTLKKMNQEKLYQYILDDWMDAEVLYPPYVKVTGMGNKEPYTSMVMDPLDNPKLKALAENKISLVKVGNESIGVQAGTKKIMKMRFKFESEKMASSLKMSGEPW